MTAGHGQIPTLRTAPGTNACFINAILRVVEENLPNLYHCWSLPEDYEQKYGKEITSFLKASHY